MLIAIGLMGEHAISLQQLGLQVAGAFAIVALLINPFWVQGARKLLGVYNLADSIDTSSRGSH